MEEKKPIVLNKLQDAGKRYITLNMAFLLLLFFARLYEYFYLNKHITLPNNSFYLISSGYYYDIIYCFRFATVFLIPYILVYFIFKPLAYILYSAFITLFIILEFALIQYFASTSLILGADLYGYSFDEIIHIASASGSLSFFSLLPAIFGIAITVGILYLSKFIKPHIYIFYTFLVAMLITIIFLNPQPEAKKFQKEMEYNLVSNKASHFISASYSYFFSATDISEDALKTNFYSISDTTNFEFKYINENYPFLHKDETPDMLGQYFNIGENKPNIVFIIVESLGRAYSGEGAYMKSFTPFIDSLENKSLYWENTLSTAGRTFEALPSVLASLPFGKNGFAELGNQMPDFISIISLLKKNNYYTRFFCGADSKFDNIQLFLSKQKIDEIVDEKSFGNKYKKMPSMSNGFTWGYGDKELFEKGIENLYQNNKKPRLDIFLTLTMHDPYIILQQEYYNKKAEAKFSEYYFDENTKKEYRKYLPNYASILYFDDAIKKFFSDYKKHEDFNNTIFIITGDHRMSSPPISTQIDRFHVPLIIYSQMLKKAKKFSSVVSHLNITPSIISFLKKNYNMYFPTVVPWIGKGLDSVATFRNTNSLPFIRTKSEMIDYLENKYYIVNDQIFEISDGLGLVQINDDINLSKLHKKFEQFKLKNKKTYENNKLIPDSLKVK
ncbi:MAG: sulfatase-like hydrolase/transferase [Bacteroidetes bacterium]|nr:sulfatase-like hydrolase/transferase [Bacteroidota bacterium]